MQLKLKNIVFKNNFLPVFGYQCPSNNIKVKNVCFFKFSFSQSSNLDKKTMIFIGLLNYQLYLRKKVFFCIRDSLSSESNLVFSVTFSFV